MSVSKVSLEHIDNASQSSYSRFSFSKDESMLALHDTHKNHEYSFHTDPEMRPHWSCQFKRSITLSKLVIYNRDNESFFTRISELQVLAKQRNGSSHVIFHQVNPLFTGKRLNRPLVIEFDGLECLGLTIQAVNYFPMPLHLQHIEIYHKESSSLLEPIKITGTRAYSCKLNRSGFVDKLLDLAASSHILESLGFRFAGIDPKSFGQTCRITNNEGNAGAIYESLGLTDLTARHEEISNPCVIELGHDIHCKSFSEIRDYLVNILLRNASDIPYTSIQLSMSPILCSRLLSQDTTKQFASSLDSGAIDAIKRKLNDRMRKQWCDRINIVIHIRLGDVTNLSVDKDRWIIPFDCIWNKTLKILSDAERKSHERYDRLPLIERILNALHVSPARSRINLTIVSDEVISPSTYLYDQLRTLFSFGDTGPILNNAFSHIPVANKVLKQICDLADNSLIGESGEMFVQVVQEVLNADVIISTNGHYCYQLASLSEKNPFMAMAYMDRTRRDPGKKTYYWTSDDENDARNIINAIESIV